MSNKLSNRNQALIPGQVTLAISHEVSTYPSKANPFFLNSLTLIINILWYFET